MELLLNCLLVYFVSLKFGIFLSFERIYLLTKLSSFSYFAAISFHKIGFSGLGEDDVALKQSSKSNLTTSAETLSIYLQILLIILLSAFHFMSYSIE